MAFLRSIVSIVVIMMTFATAQAQQGPGQFTLTVYQPGSPLDGQVVNADGEAFFLGGSTSSYCPLTDQTQCPAGNQTVFAGMDALWVEVPGGQQVYVTPGGALSFTAAHSASIPPGSFLSGFTNVTIMSDCSAPIHLINWQTPSNGTPVVSGSIFACPQLPSWAVGKATYQIFVNTPTFFGTGCTTVEGLLAHETSTLAYGAWQYT